MTVDNRLQSWLVEGSSLRVDCADTVLRRISSAVRDGFRQFRHGGMEVGGILIGSARGSTVRVVDVRPMDIVHGRGAYFLLTDAEHDVLHNLVQQTNQELASQGLGVVGYYESHTRRAVSLAETDLEIYDGHFRDPLHVCIIQKPDRENAIVTAVYIRDEAGNIVEATEHCAGLLVNEDVEPPIPQPVAAPVLIAPTESTATGPIEVAPALVAEFDELNPTREAPTVYPMGPKLHPIESSVPPERWVYAAMVAAVGTIGAVMLSSLAPSSPPTVPSSVAVPIHPTPVAPVGSQSQAPPTTANSTENTSLVDTAPKPTPKKKRGKQARSRRSRARGTAR